MANDELRDAPGRSPPPPSAVEALRERAAGSFAFNAREMVALAVLGLVLLAGAGITYVRARPQAATAPVAVTPSGTAAVTDPAVLVIHIAGAVRDPGVYRFDEGARVIDAVRAAGGAGRYADLTAVNLARPLTDGEQIVIPRRARHAAAAAPTPAGEPASDLININLASAGQLEELPGIGPVLAQRIVDYREQHGPFASPRDLMNVSGIGPKTFESIEPHITV